MWTTAFLVTFTIGGMTGVMMSVPGVDFQVHNSVFLVAHFHNTIIGGVAFGLFAGYTYWFPKVFGFKLSEALGKCAFWCWVVGFYIAFMPLYALGLMGMTRRLDHYANVAWHPYLVVAACGAVIIFCGILFQLVQLVYSIKHREKFRVGNDPWDARTLEWSIPSPPAFYNFAVTPVVDSRDAFWKEKQEKAHGHVSAKPHYEDIHMPRNTSLGFIIGIIGLVFGFAMVWNMTLLSFVTGIAMLVLVIARTFNFNIDYYVTAAEVEKTEAAIHGAQ
jgi:cytochrome o ubiquinol oxidase subunit 1